MNVHQNSDLIDFERLITEIDQHYKSGIGTMKLNIAL